MTAPAPRRGAWARSTSTTSLRRGLPVTTACGNGVPSNDTATALATRAERRFARPGRLFCSITTIGTRHAHAANAHGTLA